MHFRISGSIVSPSIFLVKNLHFHGSTLGFSMKWSVVLHGFPDFPAGISRHWRRCSLPGDQVNISSYWDLLALPRACWPGGSRRHPVGWWGSTSSCPATVGMLEGVLWHRKLFKYHMWIYIYCIIIGIVVSKKRKFILYNNNSIIAIIIITIIRMIYIYTYNGISGFSNFWLAEYTHTYRSLIRNAPVTRDRWRSLI